MEPKISTQPIAEKKSSYRKWIETEGIPLIEGFFIEDLTTMSLYPWDRKGGLGARICLEGTGETNDSYVCEIPPGKSLKPQRHLFEELGSIAGIAILTAAAISRRAILRSRARP